jgi:hypothetical protein
MTDQILEWAPYRLKPGVDEAALLGASERLQRDFLAHQDGFVRRELIKGAEGAYIDLVWWDSFAASQAAMRKAAGSPACKSYMALMDCSDRDPLHDVQLFGVVRGYRPPPRLLALAI